MVFFFLKETKSKFDRIEVLCGELGFTSFHAVDCVGASGGLALF